MAILNSAPTPAKLAEGWEQRFGPPLRRAAGRDGVLTGAAIDRLAQETNTDREAADNAKAILDASGQRSMNVEKMLKLIGAATVNGAQNAVGPTGKIALERAELLPANLRPDFLLMRGRLPEVAPLSPAEVRRIITQMALDALDNGTAQKISGVPYGARGVRALVERVEHPASNTHFRISIIRNQVWISRASQVPSPLVGWYKIGAAPSPI